MLHTFSVCTLTIFSYCEMLHYFCLVLIICSNDFGIPTRRLIDNMWINIFLTSHVEVDFNLLFFVFCTTQTFKSFSPSVFSPCFCSCQSELRTSPSCFETSLDSPTYTDVFTSLSWLVSFYSGDYRSFDWREPSIEWRYIANVTELAENGKHQ